jgi:aryl-alcohol dehydrogenase-like predicted oxidoreductase
MTTTQSGSSRIPLGRSGLMVSPICYGSWQLSPMFWGAQPEDVLERAMQRAFEVGVNFYDTADAYGNGLSETVMGRALKPIPRDRIVIATKGFFNWQPDLKRFGDLSKAHLLSACEASLKRLQTDYIDLYQCHSYDNLTPVEETVDALETLKRQGKIRQYGHSNWSVEQMRLGERYGKFTTTQPPYSLIKRDIEHDILPFCQTHDIGTLVYSPLQKGLLSGKYTGSETFTDNRNGDPDFTGTRFKTICSRVQQCKPIAEKYNLTLIQLFFTVSLMHPGVTTVIAGIKTPAHIEEAAGAMGKRVSAQDYHEVRTLLTVPR